MKVGPYVISTQESKLLYKMHGYNCCAAKETEVRLCVKTCNNPFVVKQFNLRGIFGRYLQAAKIMHRKSVPFPQDLPQCIEIW